MDFHYILNPPRMYSSHPFNGHDEVSRPHLWPFFVYVSFEGSGKARHLRSIALDLGVRRCDKHQNLMCRLRCVCVW